MIGLVAADPGGTDSAGMSPLQRLIIDRMRELGLSPKQVENRGVKHATLHRYMNPVRMSSPPRQAIMQSLADALDLDVARVQQAAVDSVGYAYRQDPSDAPPMTAVQHFPDGLRIVRTVYEQVDDAERLQLERDLEVFVRTWQAMRARDADEGNT